MDRVIEQKKGIRAVFRKKNIPYFLAGVFVIFVLWLLLRDKSSTLKVDANTVTIGDVRLGEFDDYVRVSGQVQPITVVQVSLLEGGVVEEKLIEEGTRAMSLSACPTTPSASRFSRVRPTLPNRRTS